jgi:hypothetical protein
MQVNKKANSIKAKAPSSNTTASLALSFITIVLETEAYIIS